MNLSDEEIKWLCAEAMGINAQENDDGVIRYLESGIQYRKYIPLQDDAQAMALVKKFGLMIFKPSNKWQVVIAEQWNKSGPGISVADPFDVCGESENLNRAICECVAKMQKAKGAA